MVNDIERTEGIERRGRYFETGLAAFKRISWGAVFGGLVIALVVHLMLSLLGIGIGIGTVDPMHERDPFAGLGIGALIWGIFTMLLALFAGGYVAGRLAGIPKTIDSVLHGLITFSLFTIVTFYLITTTIGAVISGIGGIVGQTASLAGQGVGAVAGKALEEVRERGIDLSRIKEEAKTVFEQTDEKDIDAIISQLFRNTDREINREDIVNTIVARTDMSHEEANRIADKWMQTYQEAKQKFEELKVKAERQARETGQAVASAVSKVAIFSFIGLLLGAAVSALGSKLGEPHDIVTRDISETGTRSRYPER
ncbi:MAG: hypothetical protein E3K32_09990 [wastewater metagenome]|nr:hypothetical protein [Candidatus Loosdrechtia aerotolerans]